jgi:alcohol dehydrogenase (NADP+)
VHRRHDWHECRTQCAFAHHGRRSIAGSLVGGIQETQEMLDFCAQHQILSDIEMIPMNGINQAYERMQQSDVKYRFVIDMSTLA